MPNEGALIVADEINPADIFKSNKDIEYLLVQVRSQAMAHVPILDTDEDRKAIASIAYRVARSKTLVDDLGKDHGAYLKLELDALNSVRKYARDTFDEIKKEVRQPLTDWENEIKAKEEREKFLEEYNQAWGEAIEHNDFFNKQQEIKQREAKLKKAEEEQARKEREAQIAKEAEEKARQDAEEKIQRERDKTELAINRANEATEHAEAEKQAAIRAEQEKAAREAEEREKERLRKETETKAEQKRIAQDKEHRRGVNLAALASFEKNGIDEETAKEIIGLIANGKINSITINY